MHSPRSTNAKPSASTHRPTRNRSQISQRSPRSTVYACFSRRHTDVQLIVEHNDPWDAFQPISHFELLPFRDAGNGINEYGLTVQVGSATVSGN